MGGNTVLRRERMERQDVDVIQFNANARRVTVWQAPRLGCEYLYDKAEVPSREGSMRIDMEVKATKPTVHFLGISTVDASDTVRAINEEGLKVFGTTFIPPLSENQVTIAVSDPDRIHHDAVTVNKIIDTIKAHLN